MTTESKDVAAFVLVFGVSAQLRDIVIDPIFTVNSSEKQSLYKLFICLLLNFSSTSVHVWYGRRFLVAPFFSCIHVHVSVRVGFHAKVRVYIAVLSPQNSAQTFVVFYTL
jgi:hypothetical protein